MESRESRTVLRRVQTLFSLGSMSALSDGQLVEVFLRRRDTAAEEAFAGLVERHGEMVLRVCFGVLRDTHAAEDAFQATFLILARKAGSIRKHASVASWLFGVARRVAGRAKLERGKRAAHERRSAEMAHDHAQQTDPTSLLPEVQEEVDRLPEKYRAPIILCYFEGLTHEETANLLQVPVGTVKVRLARARGRLSGRLIRRGLAPAVFAAAFSRGAFGAVAIPVADSTIKAAMQVAAGRAAGVSAPVAALVQGVLRTMLLTKVKTTAALTAAGMTLIFASVLIVAAFPRPVRSNQAPERPGAADAPRKVAVETVQKTDLQRISRLAANVQAFDSVNLAPRISGYLKNLTVDLGDAVKHGQLLAEIDAPELDADQERSAALVAQAQARVGNADAAVMVAEASLQAAKTKAEVANIARQQSEAVLRFRQKSLERVKELAGKNAIEERVIDHHEEQTEAAKSALSEAEAQVATTLAGIEEAKAKLIAAKSSVLEFGADLRVAKADQRKAAIQLKSTKILAPFDGIVAQRGFHIGDFIRSGDAGGSIPLLTVMRTDKMRVIIEVPDSDVPLLNVGDAVRVQLASINDHLYRGKIARMAYAEDPQTRTLRAEVDLENADSRLRPGQYGTATIVLEDLGKRLTVPLSALREDGRNDSEATCFRIERGKAIRTRIKTGQSDGSRIEVVDGLSEGDSVIIHPRPDLTDGQVIDPAVIERSKEH